MIIEKGREWWRKVNHLQKNLMIHMGMDKVIEVRPDGHVQFEAKGKQFIIEPSGEAMGIGARDEGSQPEEKFVVVWEEASPDKRQEWLQKLNLPLQYRHKHYYELRQGVQNVLTKEYFLGALPQTEPRKLQTFKGYTVDYRLREFRSLEYGKSLKFIPFDTPEGQKLVEAMKAEGVWNSGAVPDLMPQTVVEDDLLKYYKVPPTAF